FIHYNHEKVNPHSLSNNRINSLYEDNQGQLWVGTGDGLNRFDEKKQQFTHFLIKGASNNTPSLAGKV
ncbi:MAG: hypothetical protein HRT35_37090, partial [Algicola sp.]|nr:hypothetical protein [Algicola sp.]